MMRPARWFLPGPRAGAGPPKDARRGTAPRDRAARPGRRNPDPGPPVDRQDGWHETAVLALAGELRAAGGRPFLQAAGYLNAAVSARSADAAGHALHEAAVVLLHADSGGGYAQRASALREIHALDAGGAVLAAWDAGRFAGYAEAAASLAEGIGAAGPEARPGTAAGLPGTAVAQAAVSLADGREYPAIMLLRSASASLGDHSRALQQAAHVAADRAVRAQGTPRHPEAAALAAQAGAQSAAALGVTLCCRMLAGEVSRRFRPRDADGTPLRRGDTVEVSGDGGPRVFTVSGRHLAPGAVLDPAAVRIVSRGGRPPESGRAAALRCLAAAVRDSLAADITVLQSPSGSGMPGTGYVPASRMLRAAAASAGRSDDRSAGMLRTAALEIARNAASAGLYAEAAAARAGSADRGMPCGDDRDRERAVREATAATESRMLAARALAHHRNADAVLGARRPGLLPGPGRDPG